MEDDIYASHLPYLKTLGREVTSVLEFGLGRYSTPLFLDRAVFPKLERMISIETDAAWLRNAHVPSDHRLLVAMWPPDVLLKTTIDPDDFDLVFVDNGGEDLRIATIEWLASLDLRHADVVIHDFEHEPYQRAAAPFQYKYVYKERSPWTAKCWND